MFSMCRCCCYRIWTWIRSWSRVAEFTSLFFFAEFYSFLLWRVTTILGFLAAREGCQSLASAVEKWRRAASVRVIKCPLHLRPECSLDSSVLWIISHGGKACFKYCQVPIVWFDTMRWLVSWADRPPLSLCVGRSVGWSTGRSVERC